MTLPPNAIPLRPVIVNRRYGDWLISHETDDWVSEVIDAHEAGATHIEIVVPRDAA